MHTHRTCSDGYECIAPYRGNPWGFCCSTKIEGRCPNGSHVYLYPENGEPQKCTVGVTTCRIGYTCQSQTNSIVGFCCNTTSLNDEKDSGARNETLPLKNTTEFLIANEGLVSKEYKKLPSSFAPVHSYAYDLMTVLSCPYQLTPSYLTDSQTIMECTKAGSIFTSCPAPAKCVRAPRDVLRRSVCCSS
ncbi:hypothetical protein RB195_016555 [Necator americanus]